MVPFLLLSQVKVGEWVDHSCYSKAISVARSGNFVYTANENGLVKFHVDDNSVEKFTKINGLSDIGIKLLRQNYNNDALLVIYDNANIDVIKNETVINFSDIKRKAITGNKIINEAYFHNQLAYLACGFGIIVFDTDKLEIKDTYYIGPNGSNINVYQVTSNDTSIIAATESGIYYANINSVLNNFQNWKKVPGLPAGPYNGVVKLDSKIYANYSEMLKSNQSAKDTLFEFDGNTWLKSTIKAFPYNISKMYDYDRNHKMLVIDQFGAQLIKPDGTFPSYITNYGFDYASINDVYYEDHSPNYNLFWVADEKHGFIKSYGGYPEPNTNISVNGPLSNYVNDLDVKEGFLYTAPVYLLDDWSNSFLSTPINSYLNKSWTGLSNSTIDSIFDINCVTIDPNDKNHVAYGSWGQGIIECRNNQIVKIYNTANSPVSGAYGGNSVRVGGILFDKNSNLVISASHNNKFINVLKKNGTWKVLDFTAFISSNPTSGKMIIDKNDQLWLQLPRGAGMMVYKDAVSYSTANASNTKMITTTAGAGALPTADIYSLVEDLDGHIWVGTGEGIAVFYNPENVFAGGNWDSQQILIEQDGHTQILLQTEIVTALAVDGANRKWVGTESSGLYCFSPDGQEQIYHFSIDNSPIYSNTIRDVVVDETTGDVFVATDKGIQSYRTSIIKGFDDFTDVHVFPNPARPGYTGKVYVTGLINEAIVKVTDIAGNLVWETKSQGGQIEWDLHTFSGTKAASGVYLIYCTSSDGEKKAFTKLLVVN